MYKNETKTSSFHHFPWNNIYQNESSFLGLLQQNRRVMNLPRNRKQRMETVTEKIRVGGLIKAKRQQ